RSAWDGAGDADALVHLVDCRPWAAEPNDGRAEDEAIIARLKELNRKAVLALNKIDLVYRPSLLKAAQALHEAGVYSYVFMISCLNGDRVEALAEHLVKAMPGISFLFPPDQAADMPVRLLAAVVTREKLMLRLHQELPSQLTVETESWASRKDG